MGNILSNVLFAPSPEASGKSLSSKVLDVRNSEWKSKIKTWRDLYILTEGGYLLKENAEKFLKKRPSEEDSNYAARADRLCYQDIISTAVGWFLASLFRDPVQVAFSGKDGKESSAGVKEKYEKFLKNVDKAQTSFQQMAKDLFSDLIIYGATYVLTDRDPIEGENVSLLTAKQQGLLDPHLTRYSPIEAINWSVDRNGELDWIVFKTIQEVQVFKEAPKYVVEWRYFDRTRYEVWQAMTEKEVSIESSIEDLKAELIKEGSHPLSKENRVPVRRIRVSKGLWLGNRVYLLLSSHLNADNALDWALFMSALAMPVVIGPADVDLKASEAGYISLPEGSTYTWTEPQGNSFSHLSNRVESLREEAFRTMHLHSQGRSMRATPAMQSGRSKELEMVPASEVLNDLGKELADGLQGIMEDVVFVWETGNFRLSSKVWIDLLRFRLRKFFLSLAPWI